MPLPLSNRDSPPSTNSRRPFGALLHGVLLFGALASSCTDNQISGAADGEIPAVELRYRERYAATTIRLQGAVLDDEHLPIAGAVLRIEDTSTTTDDEGQYQLEGLSRQTSLLSIGADGYRSELLAVWLRVPLDEESIALDPVFLSPPEENEARFVFAGDSSLGRGFMSPEGENPLTSIPEANPDVLISSDNAEAAARAVVCRMKPVFELADYATLNLETVVTDTPETPYQGKPYVFFSLPGSLSALEMLGIGFASLGNNHMYDYLEQGLSDTIRNVASRSIGIAGAGLTPAQAFKPFRLTIAGNEYSMVSASSILGDQYDTGFVATDEKGGAADAWDTEQFAGAISAEAEAGRYPIVHLHSGAEYTERPVDSSHERMQFAIDSGASLVIAHHPHVPQGFEWYRDRLIAHSLGNFVFDQERLETMLTQVLRAEIRGPNVRNARSIPVFIEDFQPRPFAGAMADVHLRHIGSISTPYSGLVFPYLHQGWVVRPGEAETDTKTIDVPVTIDASGVAIVDLRLLADSKSSVASVEVATPGISARIGQDILRFGDMEDVDVDADEIETSRWWYSNSSSFPCMHNVHRGAVALCSYRTWDSAGTSVIAFRYRIRVLGHAENEPNKDLSLIAYTQADNAGPVMLEVRYYASEGEADFGAERIWDGTTGSWDWKPVVADLHMPADDPGNITSKTDNARALRIFIEQSAPKRGEAFLRVDDVAVINWEEFIVLDGSEELSVPHPRDFIRFEGEPGKFVARVTLKTLRPMVP